MMTKPRRPLVRAAVTLATVLAASGTAGSLPAAASEPALVNVLACQLLEGGETSIPAGRDLALRLPGFAQGNRGLLTTAVKAATATVTVSMSDGSTQVIDVTDTIGITNDGPLFWVSRPATYDVGPLEAGDVLTVTYQLTFAHPVAILYPPVGPTGANGPYLTQQEESATCRITAHGDA